MKKAIAIALVSLLVVNLILFALRRISVFVFWSIIGMILIITYFVFPKIKDGRKHKK